MTSDRWQQISQLYHDALTRDVEERAAFLAAACGADEPLRREVESLLAQPESAQGLLEGSALRSAAQIIDAGAAALMGQRLGVYHLQAWLGAGGMGEVYRGRDSKLERDVAIKILPQLFTNDPQRLLRFEREARILAALNHPNIGAIYGFEDAGGIHALVLELVDGAFLADKVARGPLSLKEALGIARQITDALEAAHDKGIIHRDLKPRNVGLTRDGIVKVLDFGLAKAITTDGAERDGSDVKTAGGTREGVVLGTAAYMSPEQARGQSVDKRTDIWAFGCVLYEMLTGQRVFPGATFTDTIAAVIERDPDWTLLPATTPGNIRRLLERCLVKDPRRRLRDIGDARIELDEALNADRSSSQTAARVVPVDRRWRTGAIVMAIMVPAAAAVAGWIARPVAPSFEQLTFRRARIGGARFASNGAAVVYSEATQGDALEISRLDLADSPLGRSLNYPVRSDVLAVRAGELALSLNRRFVIGERFVGTLAIAPLGGGTPHATEENIEEADWDRSGAQMAVVRSTGDGLTESVIEFPVGHVLRKTNHSIRFLRVSPDAQQVAFVEEALARGTGGHVAVVDLNGNVTELTREWDSVRGLAWTLAGDEIWFAAGAARSNRALRAVNLARRERVVLDAPGSLTLWDIAADGRVLLSRDDERRAVVAAGPGTTVERDLSWFDDTGLAAISDDGKRILGGDRPGVFLRPTDGSSAPLLLLKDAMGDDLSPDGNTALATLQSGRTLLVVPTGPVKSRPLPKPETLDVYRGAKWFPDGQRVLFTGSEVGKASRSYIQDINGGLPEPFTPEDTRGLAISPKGDLVAVSGGKNDEMSLWPTDRSSPRPVVGAQPGDRAVAWSEDGRLLWVFRRGEVPAPVYQLDLMTGTRRLWKSLVPPDAAGVYSIVEFRVTPRGDAYAYSYTRLVSQLYLVRGLK